MQLNIKKILVLLLLTGYGQAFAQIKPQGLNDQAFPTFYQQRSSLFRLLAITSGDVVFLGNSITNGRKFSINRKSEPGKMDVYGSICESAR